MAASLCADEVVALPTETVYGLAANAFSPVACERVFAIKGRPANDPLIVHIHDLAQLDEVAFSTPEAECIAKAFWPGALTMVLRRRDRIPDNVTSGLATVAVRMPAHPVMRAVLQACGKPLAAPSANPFGYISPTRPEHVLSSLGEKIRFILDGGPCEIGLESTILDLSEPRSARILRPGAISASRIKRHTGMDVISPQSPPAPSRFPSEDDRADVKAPGMLARHYSPRKPLILFENSPPKGALDDPSNGFLWLYSPDKAGVRISPRHVTLAPDGRPETAARNLFHELRRMDESPVEHIWAQLPADEDLGVAIRDRLRRAANQA